MGPHEDVVGHGTACAGIIRALAPDAEIHSVRVLGPQFKGRGLLFHGGIRWAVDHHMAVANLSLSSKSEAMFGPLHEVADAAYFGRTLLVSAANNQPGPTYPSQYASVVSVAARPGDDPWALAYNPRPPVEFGARGIDVDVAWGAGQSIVATGKLRGPARGRDGRGAARQAPRAHAVPGEGRPPGRQRQRRGCVISTP